MLKDHKKNSPRGVVDWLCFCGIELGMHYKDCDRFCLFVNIFSERKNTWNSDI